MAVRGRWARVVLGVLALGAGLGGAAAVAAECRVVEDFRTARVGEFPPEWKGRKDAAKEIYRVQEENGRRFLRATARGQGIQAARQVDWDLQAYPVLAWAWRPREFPRNADERQSKANDSALAVYAVFPHSPVSAKTVKYVWSALVPRGTHLSHTRNLTQLLVLRTGAADRDGWVEERVNIRADYAKYFGGDEVPKPAGIAVLTDADDTKSVAAGDYADFRICRE
jgi:hypothetical protein